MMAESSSPGQAGSSGACPSDFVTWVKLQGGEEDIIRILHYHGFRSTMSLSK